MQITLHTGSDLVLFCVDDQKVDLLLSEGFLDLSPQSGAKFCFIKVIILIRTAIVKVF